MHILLHMQIRHASIHDADAIIKNNILLAKESENETLKNSTVEKGVKTLLKNSKKGFYLLAEEDEIIIGQLMITFEWSDWRNTDIWWIQSVYVHKQFRRKGVFTALFNKVRSQAQKQKIPLLRLYVHKDNRSAQQVYEKIMKHGTYLFYEITI